MAKDAINTNLIMEEKEVENNLRPQDFDTYIGQEKIKNNLKIYIQAANERNEPIDHVLHDAVFAVERDDALLAVVH